MEETKVSKADTTASSHEFMSASTPIRVESRPALALAVVPAPPDSYRTFSQCPVHNTNVAHIDTTMIIQNPTFLW